MAEKRVYSRRKAFKLVSEPSIREVHNRRREKAHDNVSIKRIHVDKKVIMSNLKHGKNDPPVTIQTSAGPIKGYGVKILGPSEFVYRPNKPLNCGARLWIETTAELEINEKAPA